MKNKNTVIALLIIFTVICGYNLYWTYVQFSMDKQRSNLTELRQAVLDKPLEDRTEEDQLTLEQYDEYFGLSETGNDNADRYQKAIQNSFTLGLDLQGGMFVTLEVELEDLLKQLAGTSRTDSNFVQAVRSASLKAQTQERAYVDLFIESLDEVDPNANLGAMFTNRGLQISSTTPRDKVIEILNDEADAAIDRTYEIIRKRIDQFGVVSPNLQKQEVTGRILLELPGVREPERVRKLLSGVARLEFWETHTIQDAFPVMNEINERLKLIAGIVDSTDIDSTADAADAAADASAIAGDSLSSADEITGLGDSLADDTSLTSLEDLTDSIGLDENVNDDEARRKFKRENPLFAVLSPPDSRISANSPVVGYSLDTDTAQVNDYLELEDVQILIPDNMKFAWTFKPLDGTENVFTLIALKTDAQDSAAMDGGVVSNARQDFDERGRAVVSMNMDSEGSKQWARITAANVNKHVAVTLDGKVYTFPVVNEEIKGGRSQISGSFEIDEAKDLATVLKAGQLPVRSRIESEDLVGPTLGEANIRSGYQSFLGAFIVTLIFMVFYYNKAGLVANAALLANLVFILGCSAAFTIVLTLPGIAAIVLTVGMAVDANVLIFERIREEQKKGKTLKAAIKAGFSNAFSSVMDANITTFLTGVVLYAFGVGPIRGFAVSLMIGIVTSLISALIITRLILDYYANKGKDSITFGFSFTTGLFDRAKIKMVERHRTFYMISGGLIIAFLISFFTIGFKTGVDFDGGRQFVIEFSQGGQPYNLSSAEVEQIRNDLTASFSGNAPVIKTLRSDNQLQITSSYKSKQSEATDEVISLLNTGLDQNFSDKQRDVISSSMVGPTLANDIQRAAFYAVLFSLFIIFFYILLRFRKWQYSAGAIAALFHDVIIVLGVYSVLSMFDLPFNVEINQAMIAALLTIIGYSINDTVVVFDRIRENLGEMKASKLNDIYNISIDQTISRTIITSVTTLLTVLILFFFGGDVIRGFAFAIIIGIMVGTYSSIFVASPISLDLIRRQEAKNAAAKKA